MLGRGHIFELSSYSLESLLAAASNSDFAVLLVIPDDTTSRRGETANALRDNVIFALGLFMCALGRSRTFLVADRTDKNLQLPSDVAGPTYASYRPRADGNLRAALNDPVLAITNRVKALGVLRANPTETERLVRSTHALASELDSVCRSADAQGWVFKTRTTTLRLVDWAGAKHTLSVGKEEQAREQLRAFAKDLRAHGLRLNYRVRQPISESHLQRSP
ncbi:TIR domain-containing protein [Microbacterium sp. NPDC057944]|uniref:TIR domain-containing protein n=1 Tax=Microbacterium sp. NPDC057944 TaxID=3346286 RepID=UPI0036DAF90F